MNEIWQQIKNDFKNSLDEAIRPTKDIDSLKKKADATHRNIQSTAKYSQEKHENVLDISKKIDLFPQFP